MRRRTRYSSAVAVVSVLALAGLLLPAAPAGAIPPPLTCTAAVTADGAAECDYLPAAIGLGTLTVTAAAGEMATAIVVCAIGGPAVATVVGPGVLVAPFTPRGGPCLVVLYGNGVAAASAVGA
ncbi:MAG: hypothetical protein QOI20_1560 [Acidimicrobiaceae bacterium]|jgi:hypothetical protein|nr:hypothetical protein [Acidimicrobiaceae bacterium]